MVSGKRLFAGRHPADLQVDLNPIGLGMAAGAASGLVLLGIGSRLVMRLVALIIGMPPAFTVSGALALLAAGAMLGVLLALLYLPVKRWAPFSWPVNSTIFGLVLACLTILPFVNDPEGELALVSPWIGGSLFALLPLAYSLVLAWSLAWCDLRFAGAARRQVSLPWLIVYLFVLALAFAGMASIPDSARTPSLLRRLLENSGVPFHQVREVQDLIFALTMLVFFGLHLTAFWLGAGKRLIQPLSLAQLALAALCLRAQPRWLWPTNASASTWGEWLAWGALIVATLAAIGWLLHQRRRQGNDFAFWNWLIAGVTLFAGGFLLAWLAVLTVPALQLRNWTAVQVTLMTAPLMWPWLCLPAALIGAALCEIDG